MLAGNLQVRVKKSKVITGCKTCLFCGLRSIVASIGDCGSPDRVSITLEGPTYFVLFPIFDASGIWSVHVWFFQGNIAGRHLSYH